MTEAHDIAIFLWGFAAALFVVGLLSEYREAADARAERKEQGK